VKQHLQRQSGVANVEVSLRDGTVEITPKDDGQIEPAQLLKATYDSGVSVAELDMAASGKVVKDAAGNLSLQVRPNQSFVIAANEIAKAIEALAGSPTVITVRGQLFKKSKKQKKADTSTPLSLIILEWKKE